MLKAAADQRRSSSCSPMTSQPMNTVVIHKALAQGKGEEDPDARHCPGKKNALNTTGAENTGRTAKIETSKMRTRNPVHSPGQLLFSHHVAAVIRFFHSVLAEGNAPCTSAMEKLLKLTYCTHRQGRMAYRPQCTRYQTRFTDLAACYCKTLSAIPPATCMVIAVNPTNYNKSPYYRNYTKR